MKNICTFKVFKQLVKLYGVLKQDETSENSKYYKTFNGEFSFKQDLVLMDKDEFPKYNKNEILFVYDFEKEKMKIITSTGANMQ